MNDLILFAVAFFAGAIASGFVRDEVICNLRALNLWRELKRSRIEVEYLLSMNAVKDRFITAQAERIHAQSELLSKPAEKQP